MENRKHVRIAIRLPYRFSVNGMTYSGLTGNISLGGVYLETIDKPLPKDALACNGHIIISNHDIDVVDTDCHVVFIGEGLIPHVQGIGMAFHDMEERALTKLREFLVQSIK